MAAYDPGCTLAEARRRTAAVLGLTWPEQVGLKLAVKVALWETIQKHPEQRAALVAAVRAQHGLGPVTEPPPAPPRPRRTRAAAPAGPAPAAPGARP